MSLTDLGSCSAAASSPLVMASAHGAIELPERDPASGIVAALDATDALCVVTAVLDLESPDDVQTLLLFAWEELSYAEIADVLSIPPGTVSSRINRTRRHVQEALDGKRIRLKLSARLSGGAHEQ